MIKKSFLTEAVRKFPKYARDEILPAAKEYVRHKKVTVAHEEDRNAIPVDDLRLLGGEIKRYMSHNLAKYFSDAYVAKTALASKEIRNQIDDVNLAILKRVPMPDYIKKEFNTAAKEYFAREKRHIQNWRLGKHYKSGSHAGSTQTILSDISTRNHIINKWMQGGTRRETIKNYLEVFFKDEIKDLKQAYQKAYERYVALQKKVESYQGKLDTKEKIEDWLTLREIRNFHVKKDLSVIVYDDVKLTKGLNTEGLTVLPVQFDVVHGNFDISVNPLETLKGCPRVVHGDFDCSFTMIKSFEYAPKNVKGYFKCRDIRTRSLHNINVYVNSIGGAFICDKLTHVLGLLLINNLKEVDIGLTNSKLNKIINKHLRGDRDVHVCQEELLDAGFQRQAKI